MTEREDVNEISWSAAFAGFIADFLFSEVVGGVAIVIMLSLQGISLDSEDILPPDVLLVRQIIGVLGAVVGGVTAGFLARRRGNLHGVLGSMIGLITTFGLILLAGGAELTAGDVGFIVLNLVGAGYGGGVGERFRARHESDD